MARKRKKKVDNSIMNIWVFNDTCDIEQIKIPTKLRMDFISTFGVERLTYKALVESWLNVNKKN